MHRLYAKYGNYAEVGRRPVGVPEHVREETQVSKRVEKRRMVRHKEKPCARSACQNADDQHDEADEYEGQDDRGVVRDV